MEHAAVPGMVREQRLRGWIEAYADSLLKTCYVYLNDRGLAEDALQETFLKAWNHMEDFERKGIANEKAWLTRIAVNTCRDLRRGAWFRHVDPCQSLEELPPRLVAVEAEDHTLAMDICRLKDKYKQVVLLYYFQGMTLQETAQALDLPLSAVHRRLRKAREILKISLTGGDTDAG